jgi:hypothetical protein
MKKLLFLAVILTFLCSCTIPIYKKEVTRNYDADGKLISVAVKESIEQRNPHSRPLKSELKSIEKIPLPDPGK